MAKKYNPHLHAAILEVVDNQLAGNDPPETRKTYERLIKEGHSEKEAKELIGSVVAAEMFYAMKQETPFDPARFVAALNNLPKIPE